MQVFIYESKRMSIKEKIKSLMSNESLKNKLYIIIFESDTPAGKAFDVALIWAIIISILLIIFESMSGIPIWLKIPFVVSEYILTAFFTFEYITRLYCSPDPKKYAISAFGIIDLLATLPVYLAILFPDARYLLIIRAFRLVRVFRVFKLFNFWAEGELLISALKDSSKKIAVFFLFVVILVISIGTIIYMVEGNEPGTQFTNIPNSIYWACVTLTTVGYGDITPVTVIGKFLSAVVMLLGYTIIAVPTGIMSASMVGIKEKRRRRCPNCNKFESDSDAKFCKYCGTELQKE